MIEMENTRIESQQISIKDVAKVLQKLDSLDDISAFLEQLLTEQEKEMIPRRWEAVKLLYKNVPQREVASQLGMSLCKVTRGAKELKRSTSIFKTILENYPELR